MKKFFSKSNTIIIIVCLLFLLLILKGGIGIVYQYKIVYASGGGTSWVPDVMPFAYQTIN